MISGLDGGTLAIKLEAVVWVYMGRAPKEHHAQNPEYPKQPPFDFRRLILTAAGKCSETVCQSGMTCSAPNLRAGERLSPLPSCELFVIHCVSFHIGNLSKFFSLSSGQNLVAIKPLDSTDLIPRISEKPTW
jgi:hypothetical protein